MSMLTTYEAILHNNRLEWKSDSPRHLPQDQAMRVYVTVLDEPVNQENRGQRMAAALEQLALSQTLTGVDAAAWEREQRSERSLPNREA